MTNTRPTFVRRTSLFPPQERTDSPNASMVDRSTVKKSLTDHPRQRDQETVSAQEQQSQLAQQRLSLVNAIEMVKNLQKRNSIDESAALIHHFSTNIENQKKAT